jgi:hypothetical protein
MKIANRNNGDAGVLMKPEGSVKIVVLNGSRQIDQVVPGAGKDGEPGWVTMKVQPEAGLPKGIHQLSDATNPAKNVHPQAYGGQVLHVDQKHVYQFGPKGIVQHDRKLFEKEPVVGKCYEVSYSRGVGKVKAELSQEEGAKLQAKKAHTL